ncbi:MAG TPA: TatD family hydrolase [Bacteroidota bacterium]|nr:TatD family hydrolase [Bacteroidota bacterium]
MFIDSHAHLFFEDYSADLADVLQRARDAGIERIVIPGTDLKTSEEAVALAEQYDFIYAAAGFHPHDASKADAPTLERIERLSEHPKVVAIGEIGLDYHYNLSPPEIQKEVFRKQIQIARRRNLPIIIHSREAEADTMEIVESETVQGQQWCNGTRRGVFHCFPGDAKLAERVIGLGFYISIPGPVTFAVKPNKPNSMIDVVAQTSIDRVLLETDSPYLTPVPLRGKRNEPSNIPIIARKIAEIKNIPVEEVGAATTNASKTLFNLPS